MDIQIGIWITIVGSNGVVYKIMLATCQINAVGSAVADFAIDHIGIHILQYKSVDRMVVNTAIIECKFGEFSSCTLTIDIQPYTS